MVGNGISRLDYDREIREWSGEIWGCNRIYLEYGAILSRLTGHGDVMEAARIHRDQNGHQYQLWGGNLSRQGAEHAFTCPAIYRKDSGSTLVAQALHDGYRAVAVGFDFGGWDIHSPGIEHQQKPQWVKRWRAFLGQYGWDRVRFIGYDHLPYLRSLKPAGEYARRYIAGKPHLMTPEYVARWEAWTGRSAFPPLKEDVIMRVRFPDGREADMKDVIAEKMIRKGKAVIAGANSVKSESADDKPKRPRTGGIQRRVDGE